MARKGLFFAFVLLFGALGGTTASAAPPAPTPDHIETSNVKFIGNMPEVTDGVGARVVGNYLYVTSSTNLAIFDITNPVAPVRLGTFNVAIEWENEEVPTNGKILGISASGVVPLVGGGGCTFATPAELAAHQNQSCLVLFDVTDKANPKVLSVVFQAGNHTSACIYDCQYFWGSTGAVVDARDPKNAKLIGNWNDAANKLPGKSPHHVREIQPGIILTATQPVMLLTVRPEDGADIIHPKVIALGTNSDGRFIHSNRWAGLGTDVFALIGGETNIQPQCNTSTNGAFMTWDARTVEDGSGGFVKGSKFTMVDQYRVSNGTYTNGGPPFNVLGCSVHWFEEHPTFHNGGLVALATYESGERFLQITPEGKIIEQGYFIPVGRGSTSAPHWAPDGKTVYSIDYERGVDILQWTGPLYVPTAAQSRVGLTSLDRREALGLLPITSAMRLPLASALLAGLGLLTLAATTFLHRRRSRRARA